jgi:hypothetical protein
MFPDRAGPLKIELLCKKGVGKKIQETEGILMTDLKIEFFLSASSIAPVFCTISCTNCNFYQINQLIAQPISELFKTWLIGGAMEYSVSVPVPVIAKICGTLVLIR